MVTDDHFKSLDKLIEEAYKLGSFAVLKRVEWAPIAPMTILGIMRDTVTDLENRQKMLNDKEVNGS